MKHIFWHPIGTLQRLGNKRAWLVDACALALLAFCGWLVWLMF